MDFALSPARAADHDEIIAIVDDWWGRAVAHLLPRLFLDHFRFVGLAPAARGRGLGRRLYEEFLALARSAGYSGVAAITSPVNTGSIAFHTSMGFTVTGPVVGYDGPGRDMMVFDRVL